MTENHVNQVLGRAKNALQDYFIRKLLIPKIYFDAEWGNGRVDVLAVDRAGVGDVHSVLIENCISRSFKGYGEIPDEGTLQTIANIPAHYKYLALLADSPAYVEHNPNVEVGNRLLAPDGVGRIGLLFLYLDRPNITVDEKLRPERFRSSKSVVELADRFVESNTPNWEVRDEPIAS